MDSLAVANYPTVTPQSFAWIQAIRAEFDQLYYEVIDPHFTFVFPAFGFDEETFIRHVRRKAKDYRKIRFACRCATVVKDATNEYTHVFLVPDEGHSDIVKLHDRLYEGALAPQLRLDIPFIPHIGIANAIDPKACKELADDLNGREFVIEGTIEALDVVSYDGKKVTTIERIALEA
jgi:hypothetical protein